MLRQWTRRWRCVIMKANVILYRGSETVPEIEMILMSREPVSGGYCIAGVNCSDGRWVRLVSGSENRALTEEMLFDRSAGRSVGVLDRITGFIRRNGWNLDRINVEPMQGTRTSTMMLELDLNGLEARKFEQRLLEWNFIFEVQTNALQEEERA